MRRLKRSVKRTRRAALDSTAEQARRKLRKVSVQRNPNAPATSSPTLAGGILAPVSDIPLAVDLKSLREEDEADSSEVQILAEHNAGLPIPCIFAGEDGEADYTTGPSQMILSHDGTKPSPAILLNFGLSREVQAFIAAERRSVTERLRSEERAKVFKAFRQYGHDELRVLKMKFDRAVGVPGNEAKMARYNAKALAIKTKLAQADEMDREATQRILQAERVTKKRALEVAILLEEVFHTCRLLPPEETTGLDPAIVRSFAVPDYSSDTESPMSSDIDGVTIRTPKSATPDRVIYDPATLKVENEYKRAARELYEAREDFENRDHRRNQEAQRLRQQIADGQRPSETAEDFDLRHLIRGRKLTRRLIEAETKFAETKARAAKARINIAVSNQSSGFVSGPDDCRCSGEAVTFEQIDRPKILKWLDKIPESGGEWTKLPAYRPHEADGWESRSVGLSDSASLVAEGNERRRIDKWAQSCKELRTRPRLFRS